MNTEIKKFLFPGGNVAINTLAKMVLTMPALASLQPLIAISKSCQRKC